MIFRFLFFVFLFYLGYKLLFELIIPLYRTTTRIKRGIREMQQKMEHQGQQSQGQSSSQQQTQSAKPATGDYIDFEEIK